MSTQTIYKNSAFDILDVEDFNNRIVEEYNKGGAEYSLPADLGTARSLVPTGTGALRDFSYIAPDIPEFDAAKCVGCMECVIQCPDTAILGKVLSNSEFEKKLSCTKNQDMISGEWLFNSNKYGKPNPGCNNEKGVFGIAVDPTKCKGCGECVEACGDHLALKMITKDENILEKSREIFDFFKTAGVSNHFYVKERILPDMMLAENAMLYAGGASSCMGCGEATALRMMLAATGFVYGKENIGLVAATGCNTVYASTYPYNPYLVPWTNSLFENSPAVALGVRLRWNQMGWEKKRLWVIGGDGAMLDIGFQSLSRMLMSGDDIKVLVLDTQVYSNTGGQTSTASFTGQDAKMSAIGKTVFGKTERRKELGLIAMMHPKVFVAQTTAAHTNHFYKSIMLANEFPGPAIVNVYTTCQPEHGVADNMSMHQAKLAADTRAFPIFIYDPRKGSTIKSRLDLQGNPSKDQDWFINPKTKEPLDFISFARSEGRFSKQFDSSGNPSQQLLRTQEERLENWHTLQELAGILNK